MNNIDKKRNFISINIVVITISDTRKLSDDKSGNLLCKKIEKFGHNIFDRCIIKDDKKEIIKILRNFIKHTKVDCIISTGGTGLTGRDVTPEAFKSVLEKEIDGFGEIFRNLSYSKIGTSSLQSRALAGVANGKYLFALPGSPSACKDAWDEILIYQLDYRNRPCNLVEIMPRLKEKGINLRKISWKFFKLRKIC